jgi:plasmid segregation protein ParM
MEIFSLDLGNMQTKIKSSKVVKVLPSRFIDYDDLGDQSTSLYGSKADVSKYEVSFDQIFTYAWGTELHKVHQGKFIDTIKFEDRYSTDEFRLLASFAIGELAKDFPEAKKGLLETTIVTGVPTNDFNEASVKTIMDVLKSDHNVTINGERLNVRVNEVLVLPQPVGTVYNEMLDTEGYLQKESLQDEHITVVDCGGGTLLIDTLKNMNLAKTGRAQEEFGAYMVYENIVNLCVDEQITSITNLDVEKILRKNNDDGYFYKPNKNESINITKIVEKAKIKYTRELLNIINTTLKGTSGIDTLLFTGGGANLIDRDHVISNFKHAIFVDDSEYANAKGFYKYGLAASLEEVGE